MAQRANIVLFALGLRLRCVNFKHTDAMALYKRLGLVGLLADCGLYKKDGQPTDKIRSLKQSRPNVGILLLPLYVHNEDSALD